MIEEASCLLVITAVFMVWIMFNQVYITVNDAIILIQPVYATARTPKYDSDLDSAGEDLELGNGFELMEIPLR